MTTPTPTTTHAYTDQRRGVLIAAAVRLSPDFRGSEPPAVSVGYCLDAPERLPRGSAVMGVSYVMREAA